MSYTTSIYGEVAKWVGTLFWPLPCSEVTTWLLGYRDGGFGGVMQTGRKLTILSLRLAPALAHNNDFTTTVNEYPYDANTDLKDTPKVNQYRH